MTDHIATDAPPLQPAVGAQVERPVRPQEWHGLLHVYAQRMWHTEAYICGTREALTELRSTIDAALESGDGEFRSFAGDGEGYSAHVVCATDEQMQAMKLPYTDEIAFDSSSIGPWTLLDFGA